MTFKINPRFRSPLHEEPQYLFQDYHLNSELVAHAQTDLVESEINQDQSGEGEKSVSLTAKAIYDQSMASAKSVYQSVLPIASYPRATVVPLTRTQLNSSFNFEQVVARRRSLRGPTQREISLDELSYILQYSAAEVEIAMGNQSAMPSQTDARSQYPYRVYPSGGGLYPLEVFIIPRTVVGLDTDTYHYELEHNLAGLGQPIPEHVLHKAFFGRDVPLRSGAIVIVNALFRRSSYKYGERAYRLVMVEAGAMLQNMSLACEAIGLRFCMVCGFVDSLLASYLGNNGIDEGIVMCGAIGKK